MTITILEPSQEEIEEHLKEKEERNVLLNLSSNSINNKRNNRQRLTKEKSNSLSWYLLMWLKHLSIQHFRNYQELEVEFHPGLNIFPRSKCSRERPIFSNQFIF